MYSLQVRAKIANGLLGDTMHDYRTWLKLCLKAQRQCTAAFCYAVLHHIPVNIWEPNHD